MIYTDLNAPKRTDEKFRSGHYANHCRKVTVLQKLPIDMVEDFPVSDCLHLIDLGKYKSDDKKLEMQFIKTILKTF